MKTAEEIKTEFQRYYDNAKETLKKAKKEDGHYTDTKYSKSACGILYGGVDIVLKEWCKIKGEKTPKGRYAIDYYRDIIGKKDRKTLNILNDVYNIVHLAGYYDGLNREKVLKEGFTLSKELVDKLLN